MIYEMHVGTFTPEGTLDAAAERLGHLVDLGVDVVELLPLASFPGRAQLGLRRGRAVLRARGVRRPGRPAALRRRRARPRPRGLPRRGLQPPRPGRELPRRDRARTSPTRTHTPWGQALNLDGADSDEVRRWVLDNVQQWLRDFHVDGLRLDAVHELHDDSAVHVLEEMSREVDALAAPTGRPLWLIAESDRNDPGTVTPRGPATRRRARAARAVGRRRPPRAARGADRRDPGLLRRLRRPRARWPRCCARRSSTTARYSTFRGRPHGRPVDAATVPGWRFVGVAADPRPGRQPRRRATGSRRQPSTPALLAVRRGDPADLAVDADAVHGRGVGRPHAVAVLHRPHEPRHRAGHAQAAAPSSARTAGTGATCRTPRTPRRSGAPGWTGPSRSRSRTRGCCAGTAT